MIKNWEMVLYFLTAFFCIFADNIGVVLGFGVVDAVLLCIALIQCRRLLRRFNNERYVAAKKLLSAAEICFTMTAIVAGISLVRMAFYMIFLPKSFFSGTLWLDYLLQVLFALGLLLFFHYTKGSFIEVEKKKSLMDRPPSEKLEDFFAFINTPKNEEDEEQTVFAEKEEKWKEPVYEEQEPPDFSVILDDTIPDEEDFQAHLQKITLARRISEPVELWECPLCGSLNPTDSLQCDICGANHEN